MATPVHPQGNVVRWLREQFQFMPPREAARVLGLAPDHWQEIETLPIPRTYCLPDRRGVAYDPSHLADYIERNTVWPDAPAGGSRAA